jgi:hypothetical protein
MSIRVRPGTPEDIEWMLDQSELFSEFVGTKTSSFPGRAEGRAVLEAHMDQQPIFIADRNGLPVGFIVAVIHPDYWNRKLVVLSELMWWVQPEYRASRAAALLLLAFEACAERIGADRWVLTLEAHSPLNTDALEKRGYRLQERSYLQER